MFTRHMSQITGSSVSTACAKKGKWERLYYIKYIKKILMCDSY